MYYHYYDYDNDYLYFFMHCLNFLGSYKMIS